MAVQFFLEPFGAALKDAIGGKAQCVLDSEEVAELIVQRKNEAGVAAA